MMSETKASLTNEELVALLMKLPLAKPKTESHVHVESKPIDERRYYKICLGLFATIINAKDCPDANRVIDQTFSDPLQPWYLDKSAIEATQETLLGFEVTTLTHDQYCDWLRRHN